VSLINGLASDMVTLTREHLLQTKASLVETPRPPALTAPELQDTISRGNERKPLAPDDSDNYLVSQVRTKKRWIRFCNTLDDKPDWLALLKSLSLDNKGFCEGFVRFCIRENEHKFGKQNVKEETTPLYYLRLLDRLYRNSTLQHLDPHLREHVRSIIHVEIIHIHALNRDGR